MPLARRLLLIALVAALWPTGRAEAQCSGPTPIAACSAAALVAAGCCVGNTCTVDRPVVVTPPMPGAGCDFDFGAKTVLLKREFAAGSRTVTIEAGSLRVQAPGKLTALGLPTTPGGRVTVSIDTVASGAPTAFALEGGSGALIDVSGGGAENSPGSGGGTFTLVATGPGQVTLATGNVLADSLPNAPGTDAGTVVIEADGPLTVAVDLFARAGGSLPGTGRGGFVRLVSGDVISLTKIVSLEGGFGSAGVLDIRAAGKVTFGSGSVVRAFAYDGSSGDGGAIDVVAGAIDLFGEFRARGGGAGSVGAFGGVGGDVTLEARSGRLLVQRGTTAISVDGGPGGDAGTVTLITDSITDPGAGTEGTITIAGPVSAQGTIEGCGGSIEVVSGGALAVQAGSPINTNGQDCGFSEVLLSAVRDLTIDASISGVDSGGGGSFTVERSRNTVVNANVTMKPPLVTDGAGGEIGITARGDLTVKQGRTLDVSGSTIGDGGTIELSAGRHLVVESGAAVRADGGGEPQPSGGNAGLILLAAGDRPFAPPGASTLEVTGNLTMSGTLSAVAPTAFSGGTVQLRGCAVTIGGAIDSRGLSTSSNLVTARTSISVTGSVLASTSNTAVFRSGALPPGGTAAPSWILDPRPACSAANVPAGCLVPCPTCGNGQIAFPEECDIAGNRCTTGCDPSCRLEACTGGDPCRTNLCDAEGGCYDGFAADGLACDDATVCNGEETCMAGNCLPGPAPACDDDNPCTNDCHPVTGCGSTPLANGTPCPDGNACDGNETCVSGLCQPGSPVVCPPGQTCSPVSGQCGVNPCTPGSGQCNDGNPCNGLETCPASGFCQSNPPPPNPSCADSNVCNGNETCQGGTCAPGTPPDCTDTNPCTVDGCHPIQSCTHVNLPGCMPCNVNGDCNDGSDCTTDTCLPSKICENVAIEDCCVTAADCDDGEECTTDACAAGSCTHMIRPGPCGDVCNPGTCQAGTCAPGNPLVCQDTDVCTADSCEPSSGCVFTAIDGCCVGVPGECDDDNACTADACNLEAHTCVYTAVVPDCRTCATNDDCDPAGRCGQSVCGGAGICVTNLPPDCSDANPGTLDVCVLDPTGAPLCQHQCLTPDACNDGNACNGTETCAGTVCAAGAPPDCDDDDLCTDDRCAPESGCAHTDRAGSSAVYCRLDNMRAALDGAAPSDVPARVKTKLLGHMGRVQTSTEAAESAGPSRRALRKLKAADAKLKAIRKTVRGARRRIAPPLAETVLNNVTGALGAVAALKPSLAP